jgi:hypothetical protein
MRASDAAAVALIGVGVAGSGLGIASLRGNGIFAPVITWLASLTKAPSGGALSSDDPPIVAAAARQLTPSWTF